jgi:hypothetical protein
MLAFWWSVYRAFARLWMQNKYMFKGAEMKASAYKTGFNYLPVIIHDEKKEALWGPPLATRETALKYAQLEINQGRK